MGEPRQQESGDEGCCSRQDIDLEALLQGASDQLIPGVGDPGRAGIGYEGHCISPGEPLRKGPGPFLLVEGVVGDKGVLIPYLESIFIVLLVSSQAIRSAPLRALRALRVMSSMLPTGVGITTRGISVTYPVGCKEVPRIFTLFVLDEQGAPALLPCLQTLQPERGPPKHPFREPGRRA